MAGVRVTNIPSKASEKNLKVYFSNPRNGGGQVKKIWYPLLNNSAVVIFKDPQDVHRVLRTSHRLKNQDIDVMALPKQLFRKVLVSVEPRVSAYMNLNKAVVDELQYGGDLDVDFNYEQKTYILTGTWYQLEWALNYLDTVYDPDDEDDGDDSDEDEGSRSQANRATNISVQNQGVIGYQQYIVNTHFADDGMPVGQPIFGRGRGCLNIQPDTRGQQAGGSGQPTDPSGFQSLGRGNVNKNIQVNPVGKGKPMAVQHSNVPSPQMCSLPFGEKRSFGSTYLSNLDQITGGPKGAKASTTDSDNHSNVGPRFENVLEDKPLLSGQRGSDSNNDGSSSSTSGSYDTEESNRKVSFANDTNFTENKGRPKRNHPQRTSGIDVTALAGYADVNLTYTFTVGEGLKVTVTMDDIVMETTEAIVNPAQIDLSNKTGASRAIAQACGRQMQRECQEYISKNGHLKFSEVIHTCAGGQLNRHVSFVLHAAGPFWSEKDSAEATHCLVCTYINCLQYANKQLWLPSLAMPLISAGNFGFPLDVCVQAFYDALLLHSLSVGGGSHLRELRLVCFDPDTTGVVIMILQSLMEVHLDQSQMAALDRYSTGAVQYQLTAKDFQPPELRKGTISEDNIAYIGHPEEEEAQGQSSESEEENEVPVSREEVQNRDKSEGPVEKVEDVAVVDDSTEEEEKEDEEEEEESEEEEEYSGPKCINLPAAASIVTEEAKYEDEEKCPIRENNGIGKTTCTVVKGHETKDSDKTADDSSSDDEEEVEGGGKSGEVTDEQVGKWFFKKEDDEMTENVEEKADSPSEGSRKDAGRKDTEPAIGLQSRDPDTITPLHEKMNDETGKMSVSPTQSGDDKPPVNQGGSPSAEKRPRDIFVPDIQPAEDNIDELLADMEEAGLEGLIGVTDSSSMEIVSMSAFQDTESNSQGQTSKDQQEAPPVVLAPSTCSEEEGTPTTAPDKEKETEEQLTGDPPGDPPYTDNPNLSDDQSA